VTPEQKLAELAIELPTESPTGVLSPSSVIRANVQASIQQCRGNFVVMSAVPSVGTQLKYAGRIGDNLSVEDGFQAARLSAINAIAEMKVLLGDLSRVRQIVSVLSFMVTTADFVEHPLVSNGASEIFHQVFGDRGRHSRGSLGLYSMGGRVPVELIVTAEIDGD